MKKIFFCLSFLILVGAGLSSFAQFSPGEIAQRESIERMLRTADIVRAQEIGEGVTKRMLEKSRRHPEGLPGRLAI
jgi:uncharacterized protein YwbE